MKPRNLIAAFMLSLTLCLLAGCKTKGLYVTVQNHSNENIFRIVVFYGSGSFDIEKLTPGQTHHTSINPQQSNLIEFRFTDKNGQLHFPYNGPKVGLDYEGNIIIEVKNEYKVEFHGEAKPTL